jgi:hypothetical protein
MSGNMVGYGVDKCSIREKATTLDGLVILFFDEISLGAQKRSPSRSKLKADAQAQPQISPPFSPFRVEIVNVFDSMYSIRKEVNRCVMEMGSVPCFVPGRGVFVGREKIRH